MGFSTGRSDNHRSASGAHTPAAQADDNELTGLVKAFQGLNHGVIQAVSDFDMPEGDSHFDREFDLIQRMGEVSGHPVSVSLMQRDQSPNQWKWIMARAEKAQAAGLNFKFQVGARAIGVLLGLEATFQPFMGFPSTKRSARCPWPSAWPKCKTPLLKPSY